MGKKIKVGFVGRRGSGKHHLLKKYTGDEYILGQDYAPIAHQATEFSTGSIRKTTYQVESFSPTSKENSYSATTSYYDTFDIVNVCIPKSDLDSNNLQHVKNELERIKLLLSSAKPVTIALTVTQADDEKGFTKPSMDGWEHLKTLHTYAIDLFKDKTQIEISTDILITSADLSSAVKHGISEDYLTQVRLWDQSNPEKSITEAIDEQIENHAQRKKPKSQAKKTESSSSSLFEAKAHPKPNTFPTKTAAATAFFGTASLSSALVSTGTIATANPLILAVASIASIAAPAAALACLAVLCFMLYQYHQKHDAYQPLPNTVTM